MHRHGQRIGYLVLLLALAACDKPTQATCGPLTMTFAGKPLLLPHALGYKEDDTWVVVAYANPKMTCEQAFGTPADEDFLEFTDVPEIGRGAVGYSFQSPRARGFSVGSPIGACKQGFVCASIRTRLKAAPAAVGDRMEMCVSLSKLMVGTGGEGKPGAGDEIVVEGTVAARYCGEKPASPK